jgi:hypothetical protein
MLRHPFTFASVVFLLLALSVGIYSITFKGNVQGIYFGDGSTGIQWSNDDVSFFTHNRYVANVPLFVIVLGLLVLPLVWMPWAWRRVQREKRQRAGLCPKCGYDLRASPERCPECGTQPTRPNSPPTPGRTP